MSDSIAKWRRHPKNKLVWMLVKKGGQLKECDVLAQLYEVSAMGYNWWSTPKGVRAWDSSDQSVKISLGAAKKNAFKAAMKELETL